MRTGENTRKKKGLHEDMKLHAYDDMGTDARS